MELSNMQAVVPNLIAPEKPITWGMVDRAAHVLSHQIVACDSTTDWFDVAEKALDSAINGKGFSLTGENDGT